MSWIAHVKKYAEENKCSYGDAMKRASASYKKSQVRKGKGVKEVLTKVKQKLFFPTNKLPGDSQKVFNRFRDKMVVGFTVGRKPIISAVEKAANIITLGGWEKRKKELSYDKMFHLFLIVHLRGGSIKVEKNERINITTNASTAGAETIDVPYEGKNTLEVIMENAKKAMGEHHFFQYNAFENNCQDFVLGILRANGGASAEATSFIKQDAKGLLEKMPSFLGKLAQAATDLAGKAKEVMTGQGARRKKIKKKS
jgi:hypothetical protein